MSCLRMRRLGVRRGSREGRSRFRRGGGGGGLRGYVRHSDTCLYGATWIACFIDDLVPVGLPIDSNEGDTSGTAVELHVVVPIHLHLYLRAWFDPVGGHLEDERLVPLRVIIRFRGALGLKRDAIQSREGDHCDWMHTGEQVWLLHVSG